MIKLTEILLDLLAEKKLCPKGRAYYDRRRAAGEKPSAYLSGRAVKVCKGLMEENEELINCEACGWEWNLEDGGKDPFVCHKCGNDNSDKYTSVEEHELSESLRDWFKKEDWVRIDTAGNITGPCGTMKKGNKTTRCLPRAKANSLTKAERAATSKKKAASDKQFVPNTKKEKVKLTELRQSFLDYLKQQLPNTPDYVIQDWIYKMLKQSDNVNTAENIQDWIDTQLKDLKWETKTNFPITMDIFGDKTQKELKSRIGDEIRQDVGKDVERHKTQQNLLKSQGISKEPIIIFKTKNGKYELGEGWHRTTQAFKMYPEGFIQPNVYIGLNAKWLNKQFVPNTKKAKVKLKADF